MIKEYEGKTEKEAISKAIEDLGLNQEEFDVEIVDSVQGGIFKKGNIRIRVHLDDQQPSETTETIEPSGEAESGAVEFLLNLILKMGYTGTVNLLNSMEEGKIIMDIQTPDSSILIGKKGRNLDALQLLVNVYINNTFPDFSSRFILDIENYRSRREEYLIRLAKRTASHVIRTKTSKLLEPMNPFERRLIHTTLNDHPEVFTKSEGEGLYKRVRIYFRGSAN